MTITTAGELLQALAEAIGSGDLHPRQPIDIETNDGAHIDGALRMKVEPYSSGDGSFCLLRVDYDAGVLGDRLCQDAEDMITQDEPGRCLHGTPDGCDECQTADEVGDG